MKIWIDLANSPQVLFFRPIMKELERRGHSITITARDFAQTVPLAKRHDLNFITFGRHGGRKISGTLIATVERALHLALWARHHSFALAVSCNVDSHVLATRFLRIPLVNLYDYDHQPANHMVFRLAKRIIVPEAFPEEEVQRFGATPRKVRRYPGVKEQVYLSDFQPIDQFRKTHHLPDDHYLIVTRPPSDWSPYHRFPNPLFDQTLSYIVAQPQTFVVFLPRIPEQAETVRTHQWHNVLIPAQALDGPNLIYHADMVISAGGTMNREAAVLGTPAYTVFKGKLGSTDHYLIDKGRMVQIKCEADIPSIRLARHPKKSVLTNPDLIGQVADMILEKF